MITKAQDNFIDPGLSDTWCKPMILNKGMTGIWIARRYWLFFYIEEPIYPSVYHVFWGARLFLTIFFVHFGHLFSPFLLFLIRSLPCLARSFTSSGMLSVSICTTDTAVQRKPTILRPILIF